MQSKGMWTKHYTTDLAVYYYNAAKNVSVWQPPIDSIIHEAINLKPPSQEEEQAKLQDYYNHELIQTQAVAPPVAASSALAKLGAADSQANHQQPGIPPIEQIAENARSLQDRLAAAAAAKRQQALTQASSKRSKSDSTCVDNAAAASYLKQKSELEAASGGSNEDGGKWYVR